MLFQTISSFVNQNKDKAPGGSGNTPSASPNVSATPSPNATPQSTSPRKFALPRAMQRNKQEPTPQPDASKSAEGGNTPSGEMPLLLIQFQIKFTQESGNRFSAMFCVVSYIRQ